MRRISLFISILALLVPSLAYGSAERLRICHATGSESNPFVSVEPANIGVLMGHLEMDHQSGEDIIPPFVVDGVEYSQNWPSGKNVFENDCEAPTRSIPPPPPGPVGNPPISTAPPSAVPPSATSSSPSASRAVVRQKLLITSIRIRSSKKVRTRVIRRGCKLITIKGRKVLKVRRVKSCSPKTKPQFTG